MTPEQAAAVMAKAIAYTNQYLDDNAPRAWAEALTTTDFADACQAVTNLGSRPAEPGKVVPILPGNVIWEVRRIRADRVARFDMSSIDVPAGLEPAAYMAFQREALELVASGRTPPKQLEAAAKPTAEQIRALRQVTAKRL